MGNLHRLGIVSATAAEVVRCVPEVRTRVRAAVHARLRGKPVRGASLLPDAWLAGMQEWLPSTRELLCSLLLGCVEDRVWLARLAFRRLRQSGVVRGWRDYRLPGGWSAAALAAAADRPEALPTWGFLCRCLPDPSASDVAATPAPLKIRASGEARFDGFLEVARAWHSLLAGETHFSWPVGPLAQEVLAADFLRGHRRSAARGAGSTQESLPGAFDWPHEGPVPPGLAAMALEWVDGERRRGRRRAVPEEVAKRVNRLAQASGDASLQSWARDLEAKGGRR